MSAQAEIGAYLKSLAGSDTGWIDATPEGMAAGTGFARPKINKTLYNLAQRGRIELRRDAKGYRITGFRILEDPTIDRRSGNVPTTFRAKSAARRATPFDERMAAHRGMPLTKVRTPATDDYAAAKVRFERLRDDLGDLVAAEFRANEYAEEAIALKRRLEILEPGYSEMRRRAEEAERELASLQGRRRAELTREVVESGAMAVHSDPGD